MFGCLKFVLAVVVVIVSWVSSVDRFTENDFESVYCYLKNWIFQVAKVFGKMLQAICQFLGLRERVT